MMVELLYRTPWLFSIPVALVSFSVSRNNNTYNHCYYDQQKNENTILKKGGEP